LRNYVHIKTKPKISSGLCKNNIKQLSYEEINVPSGSAGTFGNIEFCPDISSIIQFVGRIVIEIVIGSETE
jgi:hypothetical protein